MSSPSPEFVSKEPIAVVGVGCVLPDAPDVATFWSNLLAGKCSIREVPKERWDPDLFWSPDKSAPDKTYAKIGAFVADDGFAPMDYRILPTAVQQIDPSQRWALAAARQAFRDAGYKTGLRGDEGRDFDRNRCAVILGNAMGGEQMKLQTKNIYWNQVEAIVRNDPAFQTLAPEERGAFLERARKAYQRDAPPINEDSMPGTLSNVAAGRIANVFDLSGKNFTTDAACASSLAALDGAIDTLRKGEADMVVCGGTDRSMDVTPYVEFSKIGALSPDGSRPFDKDANGFVMGEGCAIFLLRRLSDAERDGDKVYCVIRGVGGSSDGKGKGITAPNPIGQVKAVVRAYQDAEVDPYSIGYLEAHGTSTPVGDPVELQSADEAFRQLSRTQVAPGSIAVGSVKSNLGHLKSAAGAAGLLKVALAMKHGVLPPSVGVRTLNPRIDWAKAAFKVQTQKTEWPRPPEGVRRAAVSSFGFGGTNFHIVVEEHVPGRLKVRRAEARRESPASDGTSLSTAPGAPMFDRAAFQAHMKTAAALEAEPLVLDAAGAPAAAAAIAAAKVTFAETGEGPRLRDVLAPHTQAGLAGQARVGITVADLADVPKKLEQAQKAAANPAQARLAFNQGVFVNRGKPQGKVAFLFPGQGTQYVNMLRDLAQKYEVVRNTFEEADQLLIDELDGVKLTDILWPTPDTPEAQAASEKKLQLTEYTQPAVLAADVALLRLLRQWGIEADVVAGHSLGEYGALVAAGVLSFGDALHAVAARGREMAHVEVPDLGKMASVSADWHAVQEHLKGVTEYVIPANKNCPSQTVIAGSSKGVDQAVAILQQKGLQAQYLPVSAAFHSAIVAPASKPLRNVLARLDVKSPKVRVLSNVGAQPYQDDPEWIRDNLATQVASPVEWVGIVERMHAEGVRVFIEVGPKLALTNFVRDILKDKADAVAIGSNHPKKGGLTHANELFAFLGAWGFAPRLPEPQDPAVYTQQFRDPTAAFRRATQPPATDGVTELARQVEELRRAVAEIRSGHAPAAMLATGGSGGVVGMSPAPASSASAAAGAAGAGAAKPAAPAAQAAGAAPAAIEAEVQRRLAAFGFSLDDIGVSGISVGLPGTAKPLFDDENWDRVIRGENMIEQLPPETRRAIVDKNIVRLQKGGDGSAQFQVIQDIAQVIQLAGRRGGFDIADYGVDKELAESLDRTFQYAIAAGLEALRDAGIPLQRTYLQTSQGGFLPKEWKLPEPIRDETGIVFASAFPGYDNLIRDVSRYLADKYAGRTRDELQSLYNELIAAVQDPATRSRLQDFFDAEFTRLSEDLPQKGASRYEFNRKFLFNVLSMGHSQLAQFIGARGPNTQVNAACASTTQALAIAEDWIRTGRCRRVLVVGADDVTSDAMFEWIGAGFLASGAATTKADVQEAALPFDRRRHGMIVGMGAVGIVVEAVPETRKRGMRPIARLLATRVSNSAFHGSRLDVAHISQEMRQLLAAAGARYGVTPQGIAARTVFMSHETYTPARGGSASAEIHALRAAFGPQANQVVVANTKGFTGHPQGAGVEDAIVLKCLQRGQLPPIANFREPDPELGDLRLSQGGAYPDLRYALRLSAGFGSQVAMSLTELVAKEAERIAEPQRYAAWLGEVSGLAAARTEVQSRTLRIVDQGPPSRRPKAEAPLPQPVASPAPAPPVPSVAAPPAQAPATGPVAAGASEEQVLERLLGLVCGKTGYPRDLLDPNLDMEADLGIDTVKQAELFGAIREAYSLPPEEGIQIKDYPTLRKVAGYVTTRLGGAVPAADVPPRPVQQVTSQAREVTAASPRAEAVTAQGLPVAPSHSIAGADSVLERLIHLVAEKTGYPRDLLDPNLDMEADLGIDTVKQAELFGAIREAYALPAEDGIQIKDYPTLAKVAGYVQSRLGVAGGGQPGGSPATTGAQPPRAQPSSVPGPTAATATQPQISQIPQIPTVVESVQSAQSAASGAVPPSRTSQPSSAEGVDPDAVLRTVIQLVATKTGYPAEMLEPDLDMEADLGIDTVKQAELFGEVRSAFGIAPVEGLQLKDYPTLRKVAGFVVAQKGAGHAAAHGAATASLSAPSPPMGQAVAHPGSPQAATAGQTAPAPSRPSLIVRRVPVARAEPIPEAPNAVPRGPILLVGDHDATLTAALSAAGFTAAVSGQKPVGLVVAATQPAKAPAERCGAAFDAAKQHRAELRFVLAVTRQDGSHGLRAVRDPSMAAVAGLAKALRKELPQAVVKAVDLDEAAAAALAVKELTDGGPRCEVAYLGGVRHVVDVAPQPLAESAPDVAGLGIVVSGGAQGITVEMLAALAPQHPRLLLFGRTDLPDEATTWAAWDEAAWKAKEQAVVADMRAKGERVTPVSIQKAMGPMRKAAEVQGNLSRLIALGAEVLYAPVDVTDAAKVAEAVAWARSMWGKVDGVIHAAGIEVSKDLASKDRAQFDQVLGIKADGFAALMAATRQDPLRFIGAFGSVAGRFGNLGQTDYSAANEYLAKAVAHEAARRGCSGFTIAWGPWGEVGMATKGSILQIMHESGVTPIPTAEGVAHFLRELATPGIRECVVAGKVGAIDADRQVVDTPAAPSSATAARPGTAASTATPARPAPSADAAPLRQHPERYRLLEALEERTAERIVASVHVDQARDPYLRDHRVDGVPYMPGVFGIEAFAEAASLLLPDLAFLGAQDVRFASPLKQLKPQPVTARLVAELMSANGRERKVACRLTTQFVGPDGKPHGEPRLHFEATLRFGHPRPMETGAVPECTPDIVAPYPPFFHGPSFQVLAHAGPIGDPTVARFRKPAEAHFAAGSARFLSHPMVSEAIFQACGLRSLSKEHEMSLPAGIERLDVLQPEPVPDDLYLVVHAMGRTDDGLRRFDGGAVDAQGRLWVRMAGYTMVTTGPAPPMPAPATGGQPSLSAGHARASPAASGANGANGSHGPAASAVKAKASASPGAAAHDAPASLGRGPSGASHSVVSLTAKGPIAGADVALPQTDDIHFAAVKVEDLPATPELFTAEEIARHNAFPARKRANEWRAGRLAVKKAVLELHPELSPKDVEVRADDGSGRPRLYLKGKEPALWVSISHREGLAVAAVSPAPVGVDVETFEDRTRSFLEEAFSVAELKSLLEAQDARFDAACMWAAKEAALKRQGVGLRSDLKAHKVTADSHGGALVEGPKGRFGVKFYDLGGKVLAVSHPSLDPDIKAHTGRGR